MTGSHHHHHPAPHTHQEMNRVDTKSKLIILFVLLLTTILIITYEQLLVLSVITIILFTLYRVKIKQMMIKLVIPIPLLIGLTILSWISYPDQGILSFSNVVVEYSRFELSLFYLLRSFLIVLLSLFVIDSENSFFEIIYALDELYIMPDILTNILLLTYRSTLDLQVEAKRMIDVRYARGSSRKWGMNLYTYKIIGYMVGGILIRAFLKSDQRKDALYSRRFQGKLYHKSKRFAFNGILLIWLVVIASILILLYVGLDFLPFGNQTLI